MKSPHRGFALFAAMVAVHFVPAQSVDAPGIRPAPPLDEPLVARPGMMIGRLMTWDGRPVPRFTLEFAAYAVESSGMKLAGDAVPNVVAKVDGRDGDYEIRLPEGSYGLVSGVTLPLLEGNQTFRFWAETPAPPSSTSWRCGRETRESSRTSSGTSARGARLHLSRARTTGPRSPSPTRPSS